MHKYYWMRWSYIHFISYYWIVGNFENWMSVLNIWCLQKAILKVFFCIFVQWFRHKYVVLKYYFHSKSFFIHMETWALIRVCKIRTQLQVSWFNISAYFKASWLQILINLPWHACLRKVLIYISDIYFRIVSFQCLQAWYVD